LDHDYHLLAWADAEEWWDARELRQPQTLRRQERRVAADGPQEADQDAQQWAGPGWGEMEGQRTVAHRTEKRRQAQPVWAQMEQKLLEPQEREAQAWLSLAQVQPGPVKEALAAPQQELADARQQPAAQQV
jgi:hypothetical protein